MSYNIFDKEDIFIKGNTEEDERMKNRIGLLIATVLVLNTVSSMAYGFTNPLKNYNLYDDTHPQSNSNDVVLPSPPTGDYYNDSYSDNESSDKTRNETLRESSRQVYSNPDVPPAWTEGPSFYANPSFDSIVAKYKKSDFAGCLQECISYVRQNPNDTLGFYYLAMCYTKVNDKDNAIRAYEKVISLNDSPLIVKYATNGRNCVLGNENEKCYPNVNEPELIYPYANLANTDLTPVDPETLVNRNLARLKDKLSPQIVDDDKNGNTNKKGEEDKDKIKLPFGQQDAELDKFINSPYGNGLSPQLNKEYKQLQLKKIQSTINKGEDNPEKDFNNMRYIKEFDDQKTDAGTFKLAYEIPTSELENITKDPEYIKNKQELDELNLLLGNDKSDNNNMMDLLPYMTESGNKKLSPEVIQTMMMKSMMGDLTL